MVGEVGRGGERWGEVGRGGERSDVASRTAGDGQRAERLGERLVEVAYSHTSRVSNPV